MLLQLLRGRATGLGWNRERKKRDNERENSSCRLHPVEAALGAEKCPTEVK